MAQYNLHAAKTHLSRLVDRAAGGEDIVLARAGKPVARIVALQEPAQPRAPGLLRGKIRIADNFDAPLEDENPWYEGGIEPQ
jgi:prevent-host-death family protein